jgi:hypothetical protein
MYELIVALVAAARRLLTRPTAPDPRTTLRAGDESAADPWTSGRMRSLRFRRGPQ